jgi:hypothetical protein
MAAQYQFPTAVNDRLDGRHGHANTTIVRHIALIVQWHIEVHSHQNGLTSNIHVSN